MQLPWIAILISGLCWYAGHVFIPRLPVMIHHKSTEQNEQNQQNQQDNIQNSQLIESSTTGATGTETTTDSTSPPLLKAPITYGTALCPWVYNGDPCCGDNTESDSYYYRLSTNDTNTTNQTMDRSKQKSIDMDIDVDIYIPPHDTVLSTSVYSK